MAFRAGTAAASLGMAGVAALQKSKKSSVEAFGGGSYPPNGLAASVQELPQWIQKGCGSRLAIVMITQTNI